MKTTPCEKCGKVLRNCNYKRHLNICKGNQTFSIVLPPSISPDLKFNISLPSSTRTIYKEKIVSKDPRLKRFVNHDSESRKFTFDTSRTALASATFARNIPILDQGNVGSCTGNAGIGNVACSPIFSKLPIVKKYSLNQQGAVLLYSDAVKIDNNIGYPPNDVGSCGLSIAKALKTAGYISGYQHTFTLDAALKAACVNPIMVGMNWYNSMFRPEPDGRVRLTGSLVGGHEVLCRQIDVPRQRLWFDNSWGPNWGVAGRFYLTFADFGTLLSQQGDVIVLLPIDQTPPPATGNSTDIVLANAMRTWLVAKGL